MKAYYLVFIVTLLISLFYRAENDKQWKWKLVWTFLPLFLFGALRVNFGNDYSVYEETFYTFHNQPSFVVDEYAHVEYGFQLLCYLLPSYRAVLVLNSLLLCLGLGLFLYRNIPGKLLWFAILLIFLNVEKNIYGPLVGTRTGFAVAIFLLGFVFIQKRNIIAFAGVLLLAMSFHSSSLFYLPLAYIAGRNKAIDKKEIIIWLLITVSALILSFTNFKAIIEPLLVDRYESYTQYLQVEAHRGVLLAVSGVFLFYLTFVLFWNNRNVLDKNQNSLFRMGIVYIVTTLLGSMAFRASYFYNMFFICTVVQLYNISSKKQTLSTILCVLVTFISLYSFLLWRKANYGNVLYDVYQNIFGWTI